MRRRWRSLMTGLGLSRAGRLAFTAVAILGVGLAVSDAAIPRPAPESGLGPNVAAVVIGYTLALLALIASADAVFRNTWRSIVRSIRSA